MITRFRSTTIDYSSKSLADVLYPARPEPVVEADGTSHDVTEDKFVNRLWQFVHDQTRSRGNEVLLTQVADLGNRVEALNDLASQGVHSDITKNEANQCVMQMYLTVGDLLRLDDRTSAAGAQADTHLTTEP